MYMRCITLLILFPQSLLAAGGISFKTDQIEIHWSSYILLLIILGGLFLFLKHYTKKIPQYKNKEANLLEKISLEHKTKAYIIQYQDQKFLVAENQNSMAIHEIKMINAL